MNNAKKKVKEGEKNPTMIGIEININININTTMIIYINRM